MTGDRKSLRIANYDYATPGSYFVTICLENRMPILSQIDGVGAHPTSIGVMISEVWTSIPGRFPSVMLDAFVVMPDHVHGIIVLNQCQSREDLPTLGAVMGMFKSVTTNKYVAGVKELQWPQFSKHLWQTGYRDHIIRDDSDLHGRQLYIERNPGRWLEKCESIGKEVLGTTGVTKRK